MKILIVEDEKKISDVIKKGLEEQNYEVDVAYDGMEGKTLALNNTYDLIILDLILPKINGIKLCKDLRKEFISVPILMLTALSNADDKVIGLDSGADDYMAKPFNFNELLARIRALSRRKKEALLSPILKFEDIEVNTLSKQVKRGEKEIKLSMKEMSLLEFFIRNAGRALSRLEIAEKVWDTSFATGTNTIDVYINYLRNKIDKDYERKYIHTVVGFGYIFEKRKHENT